jgi:hypothetical protein
MDFLEDRIIIDLVPQLKSQLIMLRLSVQLNYLHFVSTVVLFCLTLPSTMHRVMAWQNQVTKTSWPSLRRLWVITKGVGTVK